MRGDDRQESEMFLYGSREESLNMTLRKALKTRGAFPSEEAALKVMYLALRNLIAKWERPLKWKAALNRFTMLWEDRIRTAVNG
jgi:transposase-like protein